MPPDAATDADAWTARVREALARYAEPLARLVAGRLVKPRTTQPLDDLLDKAIATLLNPPVIDRRVRELPPAARKLMAVIGLSRQPRWKVGHLISLLAALGHAEGFAPVEAMFENGLLYPELNPHGPPLDDFASWLGQSGTLSAVAFAHPAVAGRARGEDMGLPDLTDREAGPFNPRPADGLEWPLRLAALWQMVDGGPVRTTQAQTVFKRDLTRLETDEVLNAPPAEQLAALPDVGVLSLFWAAAAGLLEESGGELRAAPFPAAWDAGLTPVLGSLFAGLPWVEAWDPARGYAPSPDGLPPLPSAGFLALLLLAKADRGWVDAGAVAGWLWEHHPSWAGTLPQDAAADHGRPWVEAFLLGVAYPLRIVEAAAADGWKVRLSDLGRHFLAGGPEPAPPPAFPQTLLVQPNAEVLAYRQGLNPGLIGRLSRFARWKGIGPACTLELNPEQTYRGLESGLTLAQVVQTLNQHGMKPVPANVADLLQRWANKRERVTVLSSATLVEFTTAADLDAALARGVVSVRLTDRIGMTADGKEPAFAHLRLIGNRDYESKPTRCVAVADDGVTLTIDTSQSDLLLEAEVGKLADAVAGDPAGPRRFRLSPQSLRRAAGQNFTLAALDAWFLDRAGVPLSPAGRLFLLGPSLPPPSAAPRLVVRFPSSEAADGVMQWPATRDHVEERLGPTAVVVAADRLDGFRAALAEFGVTLADG